MKELIENLTKQLEVWDRLPKSKYSFQTDAYIIVEVMLRASIHSMKRGDPLYKLLKQELSTLGHWKNKPRGNPHAGYNKSKFGKE